MATWKGIIARAFDPDDFDAYCRTLRWSAWRPAFIVVHHTQRPSLADRPQGFTTDHMLGLQSYYRDRMGWSGGPHLFIDDRQVWVFTPLTVPGTHSPSWNGVSLGVEMLGDYEREAFGHGRGLEVRSNTVAAVASLCRVLGIAPRTTRLHREDPRTTHACPGRNVRKQELIEEIAHRMAWLRSDERGSELAV